MNALASFQLGHVDVAGGYVEQDARVVRTKFAKTFRTYFMPRGRGRDGDRGGLDCRVARSSPLGAGRPSVSGDGSGARRGWQLLCRRGWRGRAGLRREPIRDIFRRGFAAADLPYFNPHSFRDMLVRHAMTLDLTPEEMKAWSQNLGHNDVLTTFTSYGTVPVQRQGELIRTAAPSRVRTDMDDGALLAALTARLKVPS